MAITSLGNSVISPKINPIKNRVYKKTTITGGIGTIPNDAVNSPISVTIKGKTVTNLMGTDGDCEDTSKFTATNCTLALDSGSTNKVFGSYGIKLTLSAGQIQGSMNYNIYPKLDKSKYYLISAYLKKGTATNLKLRLETDDVDVESAAVTATAMTRTGIVIQPSDIDTATSAVVQVQINGSETQTGYVDGIMVNEITAEEYALGASALLNRYVWHNGTKPTLSGLVRRVGKNLFNKKGKLDIKLGTITKLTTYDSGTDNMFYCSKFNSVSSISGYNQIFKFTRII